MKGSWWVTPVSLMLFCVIHLIMWRQHDTYCRPQLNEMRATLRDRVFPAPALIWNYLPHSLQSRLQQLRLSQGVSAEWSQVLSLVRHYFNAMVPASSWECLTPGPWLDMGKICYIIINIAEHHPGGGLEYPSHRALAPPSSAHQVIYLVQTSIPREMIHFGATLPEIVWFKFHDRHALIPEAFEARLVYRPICIPFVNER